ncbi:MAG: TetR/AcrR family transcriptional regulator [Pseudomonadales bacterium]|nr:TetR/AcrR family transcriptional regulator [Pseudomonadales bacterium]MCP5185603.1 TetR/AcrR family transcriptional regulator [Pseudomonadales bacterium]
MPSREEAKDLRRQRIIEAARALIRDTAETGFSMRQLARDAGVSLVTPYNLFGSKLAILQVLLDEDLADYATELNRSRRDPLNRIFEAVTLGRVYFERDEAYYRAVMSAVHAEPATGFRSVFRAPRRALWARLVRAAVEGGYIDPSCPVEVTADLLAGIYFQNIQDWAHGEMPLEEVEARALHGFAQVLLASVTPNWRERVARVSAQALATISENRHTTGERPKTALAG